MYYLWIYIFEGQDLVVGVFLHTTFTHLQTCGISSCKPEKMVTGEQLNRGGVEEAAHRRSSETRCPRGI